MSLTVNRGELAGVLGISTRTVERMTEDRVFVYIEGTRTYDLAVNVQSYLRRAAAPRSPKDERDSAQAEFVRLKTRERLGELLERADVDRRAAAVIRSTRDRLLRLEHDLSRTQSMEVVEAVTLAVRQALEELAGLTEVAG